MSRPTIRDVAREAGVGIGTVSRVLGKSLNVAEDTRRRVQAAIERLGYYPSASARALSRGRTHAIEVIVPLLTRYFYFEVLRGVLAAVANTDHLLNIRVLERGADRDRAFAELNQRGQPDGILAVRVRPADDVVGRFARGKLPMVLVDATHPDLPGVGVDHRAAAAAMVAHLASLGHRKIALIDRHDDPFDTTVLGARRDGYRGALPRAGIQYRPEYEAGAEWSAEGGAAALDALLALPEPPTAVFAGGDTMAMGVLDRARQRGLAVPGDLAVCGYGDIEPARYLGLTTMRVPMYAMGERGTKLLLDAIAGGGGAEERERTQVTLHAELVVRKTCGAPPHRRKTNPR